MLSLELIGVIGLLFGLMVWAMVVTRSERGRRTISQREIKAQGSIRGV